MSLSISSTCSSEFATSSLLSPLNTYSDRLEIIEDYGLNTKWSFRNDDIQAPGRLRDRKIYLRSDEELAWLGLRWK